MAIGYFRKRLYGCLGRRADALFELTDAIFFSQLPFGISLEDLVPGNSFYRRLEATLDLSFVRHPVRPFRGFP